MKETLPDGTVISDMEAAGKSVVTAIKRLPANYHGPLKRLGKLWQYYRCCSADLAYGSKGLPPKIPLWRDNDFTVSVLVEGLKAKQYSFQLSGPQGPVFFIFDSRIRGRPEITSIKSSTPQKDKPLSS